MALKIYSADNLSVHQWSVLTKNSLYYSPEFVSLWRTMKGRDIFFVEEEGEQLLAGMAGVIFGRSYLSRFQSMPDGVYGGPCFSENCTVEQKQRFIDSVLDWLRSKKTMRIDIHNPPEDIENINFQRGDMPTRIIPIEEKSFEPPDNKIRKHIRTGKRRGAVVSIFNNAGSLDDFFKLVEETSSRHSEKPRFSKEWFSGLLKISRDDNRILWLKVTDENKLIGSRICFIDKSQILAWQYYSDREYSHLKPGYLMMDYIINYAIENKIGTINLGWSPPEAETLLDYKKRWGGQENMLNYYTYFSRLGKLLYSRR